MTLSACIRMAAAKLPTVRTYQGNSLYTVCIKKHNVCAVFERILLRKGVYIWQFVKTEKLK
jgi:hypothetical protein